MAIPANLLPARGYRFGEAEEEAVAMLEREVVLLYADIKKNGMPVASGYKELVEMLERLKLR